MATKFGWILYNSFILYGLRCLNVFVDDYGGKIGSGVV